MSNVEYLSPSKVESVIPDFGVSKAILSPADIFRRWCKLNFGVWQNDIKSHHFTAILPKGQTRRDNLFTFYTYSLEKLARNDIGHPYQILIWIYFYILNRIDNQTLMWITLSRYEKYLTLLLYNISIWFFIPHNI